MKLQAGKPVTGKDLIGRDKEIELILTLLQQGQSVVLLAPRRFGKTSIVLEVIARLHQQHNFTLYVDLFSVPDIRYLAEQITGNVLKNKKLEYAFKQLRKNIGQVLKNIELRQEVQDFEFMLKFSSGDSNNWDLLTESIDFIESFSSKYNKHIYCGLDEFGDINKLNGDRIVKLFRSKIQLQQNATYIFSGSSESMMESLFVSKNSPFYRLARIINLGYIEKKDFFKYLEKSFRQLKINASSDFITAILDFTNGHPFYTQLILQQIYIDHHLRPGKVALKKIDVFLDELLIQEKNYLEKLWEEISKSRELKSVVLKIVEASGSIYSAIDHRSINIPRTLKKLMGTGMILKNPQGKYSLSDPLFALWIKKNVLKL